METLLVLTNAEAADTLALVAWVLTFFIVLNAGILIYTIIRNNKAAKRAAMMSDTGDDGATSESMTKKAPKKPKTKKGEVQPEENEEDAYLPAGRYIPDFFNGPCEPGKNLLCGRKGSLPCRKTSADGSLYSG